MTNPSPGLESIASSPVAEWISLLGAIVAFVIAAIKLWKWFTPRLQYLACSLEIATSGGHIVIETAVQNTSVWRRKIEWAFLIISPHAQNFLNQLESETNVPLCRTRDLIKLKTGVRLTANDVILVPLRFFYREQVGIRDETITYSVVLNRDLEQGAYDVRFFVFPQSRPWRYGLHRCTHKAFVIN